MPTFDESVLLGLSRDSAPVLTGNGAANGVQIGGNIQDDKIRRIWRLNAHELNAAPTVLQVYAGDAANVQRRLINTIAVAANAVLNLPNTGGRVDAPFIVVPPVTSVAPTQENQVRVSDTTGGNDIRVTVSTYDLRG